MRSEYLAILNGASVDHSTQSMDVAIDNVPMHIFQPSTIAFKDVPISTGICLPRGSVAASANAGSVRVNNESYPAQLEPLMHWPDGSIRWALCESIIPTLSPGTHSASLTVHSRPKDPVPEPSLEISNAGLDFRWPNDRSSVAFAFPLHDEQNCLQEIQWNTVNRVHRGAISSTAVVEGYLANAPFLKCQLRLKCYSATGHIQLSVCLHNSRRAQHPGGQWDLGDAGSYLFQAFQVKIALRSMQSNSADVTTSNSGSVCVSLAPGESETISAGQAWHLYQDSSGKENWQSRNHVNRNSINPCQFRGYRQTLPTPAQGNHAEPAVSTNGLTVAVPEFWQQFPKSIQANAQAVEVGLFPAEWSDAFELQGGERKTHTFWNRTKSDAQLLAWVHQPVTITQPKQWFRQCAAFPEQFANETNDNLADRTPLAKWLKAALDGNHSIESRRDAIDEYGWRNYGEVRADHEQAEYQGEGNIVSHYNNQFDLIAGGILQETRTGEPGWRDLYSPLARHVMDIDCYHTDEDKSAYNHGLFWHTDHFCSANLCTHRTYSRTNAAAGQDYGGGPSCEHNYTTGLLYYYLKTGDPSARQAVIELANWVRAMDDGRQSLLGVASHHSTGLATRTKDSNYHGPGRGAGNSINALLDAWLITGDSHYRDAAETFLERSVPTGVDIDSWELLDAERRWSYVMFVATWAKYLEIKAEREEFDRHYHRNRAEIVRLGLWMRDNEQPWLAQPAQLDYPNETWAAQDLRKANAIRLAGRYVTDTAVRTELLRLGNEWAETAWQNLMSFPTPYVARCLSIIMTAGQQDAWLRHDRPVAGVRSADNSMPQTNTVATPFIPQREHIKSMLRSPSGVLVLASRLCNPFRWLDYRRQKSR